MPYWYPVLVPIRIKKGNSRIHIRTWYGGPTKTVFLLPNTDPVCCPYVGYILGPYWTNGEKRPPGGYVQKKYINNGIYQQCNWIKIGSVWTKRLFPPPRLKWLLMGDVALGRAPRTTTLQVQFIDTRGHTGWAYSGTLVAKGKRPQEVSTWL